MFFLALPPILQVQTSFATHLANGIEPREIYQDGQLVAHGIEVTEVVNGRKHFFSHLEAGGSSTEVDAWLDGTDHPISARYTMNLGKTWVTTWAELSGNTVTMKRESNLHDQDKVVTSKLPDGRISTLAQFDPLKLFPNPSIGKSVDVNVIDPVTMSVADGTLVETSVNGGITPQRAFDLSTTDGSNRMYISASGNVDLAQNSIGQTFRPAPWNAYYLDMADRAGIRVDDVLRAQILGLHVSRAPQPAAPSTGIKRHG